MQTVIFPQVSIFRRLRKFKQGLELAVRRPAAFGGEQATIEFWQTKRDGGRRGIVEIGE